jgi:hypothetical protein
MTHILHLGHQPADIAGITGLISTDAAGFDPDLDTSAIRIQQTRATAVPFSLAVAPPAGDLRLGFRYVAPAFGNSINQTSANFLEFRDAANGLLAQVRPRSATNLYHAIVHGDTVVEGTSSFAAAPGTPQWIDVRLAVGGDITLELFVEGVLQSTASAANTAGKGKPVRLHFPNIGLHGQASLQTWYYAHIAVLDGVSTIGRRFARRTPAAVASWDQMTGSLAALADGDPATRVASTAAGQRLSFTLAGPAGLAAGGAIAGVHIRQIAQAGTAGPGAVAGFLRLGGVEHDAAAVAVPSLAPVPVHSGWALNPATGSPWTEADLPAEIGVRSA